MSCGLDPRVMHGLPEESSTLIAGSGDLIRHLAVQEVEELSVGGDKVSQLLPLRRTGYSLMMQRELAGLGEA